MLKRIKGFTLIELLIVVAIIAILAAIAIPNFLEAQTRSKVSRVRADLRSLATGIEAYYIDNSSYPQQDSSIESGAAPYVGYGCNDVNNATTALRQMPSFRRKIDGNDLLHTITTPVSYITSYPVDPFATTKGAHFNYSTQRAGSGWVLWSYGPDLDETSAKSGHTGFPGCFGDINTTIEANTTFVIVDTFYYDPAQQNPSFSLINNTYDPSNGTTSGGELYRLKD